jgi:hypothetical protein
MWELKISHKAKKKEKLFSESTLYIQHKMLVTQLQLFQSPMLGQLDLYFSYASGKFNTRDNKNVNSHL